MMEPTSSEGGGVPTIDETLAQVLVRQSRELGGTTFLQAWSEERGKRRARSEAKHGREARRRPEEPGARRPLGAPELNRSSAP